VKTGGFTYGQIETDGGPNTLKVSATGMGRVALREDCPRHLGPLAQQLLEELTIGWTKVRFRQSNAGDPGRST
jgi:hypothetical protein